MKGARYCGPGALIRTLWVLLVLALVATALRFGPAMEAVVPRSRYADINPSLLAAVLIAGVVISGAIGMLFLGVTARQLDGLMGRNG